VPAVADGMRLPAVAPIQRSDQAIAPRTREEGTDGLMGRLPFGLPNDTPYPRAERVNKFTIDDVLGRATSLGTTPPWVRSRGGEGATR
jgi:hypothetical protein